MRINISIMPKEHSEENIKNSLIILLKHWRASFGLFRSLFFGFSYDYLVFLNLYDKDEKSKKQLERSLYKLNHIFARKSIPKLVQATKTLLESSNWRHCIIACIAIAKFKPLEQKTFIPILWTKIDSWVCPQVLGLLSQIDHNFIQHFKIHNTHRELDFQQFTGNTISEFVIFLNLEEQKEKYPKYCWVDLEWGKKAIQLFSE